MGYGNKLSIAVAATLCAAAVVYATSADEKTSVESLASIWVGGFSEFGRANLIMAPCFFIL